jgi:hypothetical protein
MMALDVVVKRAALAEDAQKTWLPANQRNSHDDLNSICCLIVL